MEERNGRKENYCLHRESIGIIMDALDFGCGTGLVTLKLQPFIHSITGVDGSQGMICKS